MHSNELLTGISIVIPVYNSEASLDELAARLAGTLPGINDFFEVILVNDGSQDSSWQHVEALADRYAWLSGINLMRNYGQHNALLAGIRAANYELVVTLDDDLQHPPEEIGKLVGRLTAGYDVVYGTPDREQHGFFARWGLTGYRWGR